MRMQAIAARFDAQELLAQPVDTTGWLAGPSTNDREPTSRPGFDRAGVDLPSVDQHDATTAQERADRRADSGPAVRSGKRSARRSGRVRHLRRIRTDGLSVVETALQSDGGPVADVVPSAPEGYQMGRWARLTLTITVLAAAVVVVATLIAPSTPQALVDVTVAPGDTLWSIAADAAPDRDPRDVIDEIRQLNDVQGAVLPIGVVLRVPATAE